ncbi:hypothetical protein C9I98_10940 [Photobacterium sanctipauli]|uniref:Uncharacterized protein n=1 Tax=Photobacterium sanctipauli TaxID=1342794 RepID=A0A2T3NUL7_9GAMM|nr:hypothetical protein [Photobacterium sanctipauli]PSW19963.1 hypothetical protein C9I98_10940 [Photobacterium sanctipauli]
MLTKKTHKAAVMLITTLLATSVYQFYSRNVASSMLPSVDYCNLSTTACNQEGVTVTLSEDVIRPMQASTITVDWPALSEKQDTLTLSLEGNEMMMGIYKLNLTRINQSNQFTGELMLPFCTSDEMTWQGQIQTTRPGPETRPVNISIRMIQ